ncbi:MAG: hypothetical protein CMI19_02785 [Opitutae bacterium]|nr:hypothetical protein [Opitutae bacterium]
MKKISLLTVDAAGTLLKPWPSVWAVYGKAARKKGIQVDDTVLDTQFGQAFNEVQKIAHKQQGEEKEFWRKVVELTFQPSYSGDLMDELFEELWELFARGEPWKLAEQAVQTLTTLKDKNYRLAVLSNNDSRLRSVLRELQVDHLFEHLFISSELGFEKPQREIFQAVEETLQVNPQEIMHLGDSYSRDYLGAQESGWNPVLYGSDTQAKVQIKKFPELLNLLS